MIIVEENPKRALRREVRLGCSSRSRDELRIESEQVMSRVEALEEFCRASVVALYWSLDDEISTHKFIEKWSAHKTILLPVVCGEHMDFRRFTSCEQMKCGDFDILEPLVSSIADPLNTSCPIDMIIVPGVAFDTEGHRLGRGRGYYDKFLCERIIYKVGVCFSHQIFGNVPSEPHDIVMDRVIHPAAAR